MGWGTEAAMAVGGGTEAELAVGGGTEVQYHWQLEEVQKYSTTGSWSGDRSITGSERVTEAALAVEGGQKQH